MPETPSCPPSWSDVLEQVAAGVAVLRHDGEPVFVNRALLEVLGADPRVAFAGPAGRLVFLTGEGKPYPADRLPFVRAACSGRREVADDLAVPRPEGHWQPVRVEAAPLLDAQGRVEFVVVTITPCRSSPTRSWAARSGG